MFGWLIKGEVNDDAVRLKALADRVISKYLPLSRDDLEAAVKRDFPGEQSFFDRSDGTLVFQEAPEFTFGININFLGTDDPVSGLTVSGIDKYAGFSLNVSAEGLWFCSAEDGVFARVTAGSKKLVKAMKAKFGVPDQKELMGL